MRLNAQLNAASAIANVFQIVGQRSKTAAVAAIAVNTAVQSVQAIQNTIAASVAAVAPPPLGLGPIAGAPLAAGIRTWGALQVAGIIASRHPQCRKCLEGQQPAWGWWRRRRFQSGGGSSVFGGGDTAPQDFGRAVVIDMREGSLYSSQSLKDLIVRLNEEIQNGATLIATRNVEI